MALVAKGGRSNWAYASARSKARKANLIDATRMRQLLQQEPDAIAASIAEFGYRLEMDMYGSRLSGADLIEAALNHNMDRDLSQVLGYCQGDLRDIVSIYVDRFSYQKVKTVLRAIHSGVDYETVAQQVLPEENEENNKWLEIVKQSESLSDVVAALSGTRYGRALAGLDAGASLMQMEDALDAHYYKTSLEMLPQNNSLLSRYLKVEIDHRNIINIFRALRQGMSVDQRRSLMLKGGKLSTSNLRQAEQADDESALLEVLRRANSFDESGFDEAIEEVKERDTLDPIVNVIEHQRMALMRKMSLLNPVSAFPVIYYIESKVTEVRNLRLLARGKSAGLENDVLDAHLLI